MNLRETLLEEHSKKQCDRIVRYIGHDKTRFAALMQLFFKGEYRVTQRAAWPMSYSVRKYPELIRPYFGPLLVNLGKKGHPDSVLRNSLRLLQDLSIPKKYQGRLMTLCFDFIQSSDTAVAISSELKTIIQERWELETAAFRSRAKKILVSSL
jgi:hypothetical protein